MAVTTPRYEYTKKFSISRLLKGTNTAKDLQFPAFSEILGRKSVYRSLLTWSDWTNGAKREQDGMRQLSPGNGKQVQWCRWQQKGNSSFSVSGESEKKKKKSWKSIHIDRNSKKKKKKKREKL